MKYDDRLIERLVALSASGMCDPGKYTLGVPPGAGDDPDAIAVEVPGSAGRTKIRRMLLDPVEAKRERAARTIALALKYGRAARALGTHIPPYVARDLKALAATGDLAAVAVLQWSLRSRVLDLTVVSQERPASSPKKEVAP